MDIVKREQLIVLLEIYRDELEALHNEIEVRCDKLASSHNNGNEDRDFSYAAEDSTMVGVEMDRVGGFLENLRKVKRQNKCAVMVTNHKDYVANSPYVASFVLVTPRVAVDWKGKPLKVHVRDENSKTGKTLCGCKVSKDWFDLEATITREAVGCVNCRHAWLNTQRR